MKLNPKCESSYSKLCYSKTLFCLCCLFFAVLQSVSYFPFLLYLLIFHILSRRFLVIRRQWCVAHKINALDDFAKTVHPAVSHISLCCCSCCSSCCAMGFKPCMRAGAGSTSALERKQTQTTSLILPWSVPHPHGCQLCLLSMCSQHTQQSIPNPQTMPLHRPNDLLYHTVYLFHYVWVWDLAVINGRAEGAGEQ